MEKKKDKKGRLLRNGERQRSDGRYEYRYVNREGEQCSIYSWRLVETDPTPQGKRRCDPLRVLETRLVELQIYQLDTKKASAMTVEDAYENYMSLHPKWKPSTRYNKRLIYKNHIKNQFGKRKIIDLRNSEIKAYYIYLQKEESLSYGTVRQVHALLYSILESAVDDDVLKKNPAKNATKDIMINEPKEHHAFTKEQQDRLFKFMKTSESLSYWLPYMVFLIGTGLRNGEASALVWKNVDFNKNLIYVKSNMIEYRDDNDVRVRERSTPKTKAGMREIPMFKEVRDVLEEEYKKTQFQIKKADIGNERVFKTKTGTELKQTHADRVIKQIQDQFNDFEKKRAIVEDREPDYLPPFTPHTFRRTFCTRLCEQETNIKVIQKIMGHRDIHTTLNVYAEATKDFVKDTFDELQDKIKIV